MSLPPVWCRRTRCDRARSAQDRQEAAGDDRRAPSGSTASRWRLSAVLGVAAALATRRSWSGLSRCSSCRSTLIGANLLLAPFEARVQRRYWDEAHEKLRRLDRPCRHHRVLRQDLGQAHPRACAGDRRADPDHAGQRQHRDGHRPRRPRAPAAAPPLFRRRDGRLRLGSIARLCALTPPSRHHHRHRQGALRALQDAGRGGPSQVRAGRSGARQRRQVIIAADTLEFARPREFLERHRDIA